MAFADYRFEQRRRALATELAERRLDALLVTHLVNVRYLTGFSGSNAALLIGSDRSARIATDGRYTTQVAEEAPDLDALIARPSASSLLEEVTGPRRVGVEASHLSVAAFDKLSEVAGSDVTLVQVEGLIEKLRRVKDAGELAALEEIAELAATAWNTLIDDRVLAAGRTEIEVAAHLEYLMRRAGAERPSFDTIVASGPNSAKPHHSASERVIENGDLVTVDFGAHAGGYNSDMTRTVVVGDPDEFSREIYDVVLRAQRAGVEAAVVGTPLRELDGLCRSIIGEAGFGEYFVHSTGHGIGLDVHEYPFAARSGEGELVEGMTLTVEPGIYVPGRGGVRIEDTVIIEDSGPKIITNVGKDLLVV